MAPAAAMKYSRGRHPSRPTGRAAGDRDSMTPPVPHVRAPALPALRPVRLPRPLSAPPAHAIDHDPGTLVDHDGERCQDPLLLLNNSGGGAPSRPHLGTLAHHTTSGWVACLPLCRPREPTSFAPSVAPRTPSACGVAAVFWPFLPRAERLERPTLFQGGTRRFRTERRHRPDAAKSLDSRVAWRVLTRTRRVSATVGLRHRRACRQEGQRHEQHLHR